MHVLFLLTQDLESPSGLGRYFPMAKALVQRGHQATVAALHADIASLPERRFEQEGVQVWYVAQMHVLKRRSLKTYFPAYKLLGLAAWGTLWLAWAALTTPADLIVIGKPHPMNSLAGLVGRLRTRQVVQDCDDDETSIAHFTGKWQRSVIAFFEKYAPRCADWVTTNTYHSRLRLAELGIPLNKIHYLSNGIDRQRFAPVDPAQVERLRAHWGIEKRRVITFIGSLSRPSHPVELLFQALVHVRAAVPDVLLLVVGGGDDFPHLNEQVQALGLDAHVRFTGRVPGQEIPAYYALAEVSFDPVYDDAAARGRSPLKLFESWACGVPFVSCDVGDRARLLGDPPAGLLARPGDPTDLAAAVIRILQDRALAQALRSRGLERVEAYFWDELIPVLEALPAGSISPEPS
jgi:glycosyltransferase involved in cell wall biosynthesis